MLFVWAFVVTKDLFYVCNQTSFVFLHLSASVCICLHLLMRLRVMCVCIVAHVRACAFACACVRVHDSVIAVVKDVPDVGGDRKFEIKTLSVRLGAVTVSSPPPTLPK